MAHVEEHLDIAAPIDRVFDLVADSSRALTWLDGIVRFDHVGGPARGVGAKVHAEGRFLGITIETDLEIVEFSPPFRLVSQSTTRIRSRTAWILTEMVSDTRVSFVGDYSLPLSLRLIGDRALELFVGEQTRRSLANLKRLCEGGAPAD